MKHVICSSIKSLFGISQLLEKMQNIVEEKFLGIFTQIEITFSYGIKITKFLVCWKTCYEGYVVILSRDYFGFSTVCSYCDLRKGMVHAFGFLL